MDSYHTALSDLAPCGIQKAGGDYRSVLGMGVLSSCLLQGNHPGAAFFLPAVGHFGALAGQTYQSVVDSGRQFPGVYSVGYRIVDASSGHLPRHFVHGCAVYRHECDVRHRACHRRCAFHLYAGGTNSDYSPDSDRRTRGDDADKFLCHVFYGEYLAL